MSRAIVIGVVVALTSPVAAGPIHLEIGAGRVMATAEVILSPVTHIRGQLSGNPFLGFDSADFEDVYYIYISDNIDGDSCAFSASTLDLITPGSPYNAFDTQLWLFDASGNGLLGNDDFDSVTQQSRITFPSTDSPTVTFPGAGFYYLAISGGDGVAGGGGGDDPTGLGNNIFDFSDAPDAFQISGPDGPGGASAFDGWSATGSGAIGYYDIAVNCVIPEPAVGGLISLPLTALLVRRSARRPR